MVNRFDVYLVALDPTLGCEIKKTRLCLIISPDELHGLNTVIVAPMTTKSKNYPTRVSVIFDNKKGYVVLDQIRTIDKSRLLQFLGTLNSPFTVEILNVLQEMFQ